VQFLAFPIDSGKLRQFAAFFSWLDSALLSATLLYTQGCPGTTWKSVVCGGGNRVEPTTVLLKQNFALPSFRQWFQLKEEWLRSMTDYQSTLLFGAVILFIVAWGLK
jgi:hypothetical protein